MCLHIAYSKYKQSHKDVQLVPKISGPTTMLTFPHSSLHQSCAHVSIVSIVCTDYFKQYGVQSKTCSNCCLEYCWNEQPRHQKRWMCVVRLHSMYGNDIQRLIQPLAFDSYQTNCTRGYEASEAKSSEEHEETESQPGISRSFMHRIF